MKSLRGWEFDEIKRKSAATKKRISLSFRMKRKDGDRERRKGRNPKESDLWTN